MSNETTGRDILENMELLISLTDESAGQLTELKLPLEMVCLILPIIKSADLRGISSLIMLGAIAATHPEPPTEQQAQYIGRILATLEQSVAKQFRNQEELLIQGTYHLLKEGRITRKQAAEVAKAALGGKINEESWRKRVDRYASAPERKWPLPGKPRGGNR
jgi:hypothetical protein